MCIVHVALQVASISLFNKVVKLSLLWTFYLGAHQNLLTIENTQ